MTLRRRDRIGLGVIVVLALIGAYYMLALKPARQKATSLVSQIATERQALTAAQQSYANGRRAQASLKAQAAELRAINLAVPTQPDIPALLRTLQRTATAVHVDMKAITLSGAAGASPSAAPAASTTPATPTASGASPAPAPTPIAVPVQLTFAGGYTALNNLVRRVDRLVKLSRGKIRATGPLMSINSVSLTGSPLTVQLTASLYQMPAPATTAGAATGGQG
jgi:Tfp pilus assembly protein PilO